MFRLIGKLHVSTGHKMAQSYIFLDQIFFIFLQFKRVIICLLKIFNLLSMALVGHMKIENFPHSPRIWFFHRLQAPRPNLQYLCWHKLKPNIYRPSLFQKGDVLKSNRHQQNLPEYQRCLQAWVSLKRPHKSINRVQPTQKSVCHLVRLEHHRFWSWSNLDCLWRFLHFPISEKSIFDKVQLWFLCLAKKGSTILNAFIKYDAYSKLDPLTWGFVQQLFPAHKL